jgi:histidinol dehydrogenase
MLKISTLEEFNKKRKRKRDASLCLAVQKIIDAVICRGDEALREFSLEYDNVALDTFRMPLSEIRESHSLSPELKQALEKSAGRLEAFARFQLSEFLPFSFRETETAQGVFAGEHILPVRRAGIYVPGGRFPLFSSLLMGVVPARVAGVEEIAVFTPPGSDGKPHPIILSTAALLGIDEVYALGGAHAIAAMAYGTESVAKVDMIAGPGNAWVTEAKRQVFGDVGVDLVAGPSEILVVADDTCDASLVAADLFAQAEHDTQAVPLLTVYDEKVRKKVIKETIALLKTFPETETARLSFEENSICFLAESIDEASSIANVLAPEHLQLHVKDPSLYKGILKNYGSLFAGKGAAEVLGDYVSGLNHTLPTGGTARFLNGLNVWTFLKRQTTLRTEKSCDVSLYQEARIMAEGEGLVGHGHSAIKRK